MRIIAGKLKGATLYLPQNKLTRPLKDIARENIFNLLTHSNKMSFQFERSSKRKHFQLIDPFKQNIISI